jgi:NitT/TauT family transport system permease protein
VSSPDGNDGASKEVAMAALLPLLSAALVLGLWQFAVTAAQVPEVVLPPPSAIARQFLSSLPELLRQARFTGVEAVEAFVIAAMLGMALAAAASFSAVARDALFPNLVVFQLIPKIAFAPLFVIWLGVDAPARLAVGVFLSFFPIALSTTSGLASTDSNAVRLCQSLGASSWQTFVRVRIPFALPYVFTGLKIASTLVFIGIVVGEFISSNAGLGHFVLSAGARSETPKVFAGLVALALLGLGFYGLIVLAEHITRRWWRG